MRAPSVLIAAERAALRSWLRSAVLPLGVAVETADSGRHAIRAFVNHGSFDLVIADVTMRHPNGLELVPMTRSLGWGATPFILITDRGDEALHTTVGDMGDALLLDAPFDEGQLQELVARFISEGALPSSAAERSAS